jgi:hypothetical protein
MHQMFQTIWNVAMMGISLAYFGALGTATYYLGQSAIKLQKQGLISLSQLTRSLESPKRAAKASEGSKH